MLDKELILVAIVSESGMTCFPQSNHSLDTFNTSHRLMIVPKEGPYGVRKEYNYDVHHEQWVRSHKRHKGRNRKR